MSQANWTEIVVVELIPVKYGFVSHRSPSNGVSEQRLRWSHTSESIEETLSYLNNSTYIRLDTYTHARVCSAVHTTART